MNILRVRQEEEQNIGVSMSIWLVRERDTFIQAKGPRGTQSLQERHDTNTHDFWQAPVTPHPRELWPHHFPSQKAGARKSMWSGGCRVTSWALGTRCRSPLPSPFVSGVLPPPSRPGHNHSPSSGEGWSENLSTGRGGSSLTPGKFQARGAQHYNCRNRNQVTLCGLQLPKMCLCWPSVFIA